MTKKPISSCKLRFLSLNNKMRPYWSRTTQAQTSPTLEEQEKSTLTFRKVFMSPHRKIRSETLSCCRSNSKKPKPNSKEKKKDSASSCKIWGRKSTTSKMTTKDWWPKKPTSKSCSHKPISLNQEVFLRGPISHPTQQKGWAKEEEVNSRTPTTNKEPRIWKIASKQTKRTRKH